MFGENPKRCFYDLASILYTLDEIDLGVDGMDRPRKERTFILKFDDCKVIEKLATFYNIKMLVRPVKKEFCLQDLKFSADTTQQDHTLEQFIELATSQVPLFQP